MVLTNDDIKIYLTGGSTNTNHDASLGGNVSSTLVSDNKTHNLFRRITDSEASSGITLYRCVAIKNTDVDTEMRNVKFYMVIDTTSPDSLALYSNAQAAKNAVETPISNEFTAPTGSNINFIAALNRTGGLSLGNLGAGEFINVWLRYTVNPAAEQYTNDTFKMRVECDNPNSTTDDGGGPTPPPTDDTGTNFSMAVIGDCSCGSNFTSNLNKIKNRSTNYIIFNGDLAYDSGSGCFIDLTSSVRSKSKITFGNHDVDESECGSSSCTTKTALINAWSLSKTYWKTTFNNVGMIGMEGGENESVSSSSGSTQYNFVKQALQDFSNSNVEWIFVFNHYPIYGPSSNHSNDSGVRDDYDPLFDQYGVDAVFTSHNHISFHTKLLKYNSSSHSNPTTAGTDPNYSYAKSADNHGKIYIGAGSGGKSHYSIDSVPSYVTYSNDNDYGYWWLQFTNSGKKITFKFYTNSDSLKNTFTLTHT